MKKYKIAVLDDYQNVAFESADWSVLRDRADIAVFQDHLADPDALIERLLPFDVVCVMRERSPLPRNVIERLPNLKLIASTGSVNSSIDVAAAGDRGIAVVHTGIVEEQALISVLKNKQIAGAAIDVFDAEPLPASHPFRTLDNVLATPHIGYVSHDLYKTFYEDTVSNIRKWLDAHQNSAGTGENNA